ncbi:expressed protein [Phakopsora pachyrhizi]|uniref:Expressed protein n=1 Tax=Phakopsora pachyrhizi TaxID=170000 RepID=A0AAV0ALY5_PHAPC|nr:expressed protein [Phakopsora pachyrhizi]
MIQRNFNSREISEKISPPPRISNSVRSRNLNIDNYQSTTGEESRVTILRQNHINGPDLFNSSSNLKHQYPHLNQFQRRDHSEFKPINHQSSSSSFYHEQSSWKTLKTKFLNLINSSNRLFGKDSHNASFDDFEDGYCGYDENGRDEKKLFGHFEMFRIGLIDSLSFKLFLKVFLSNQNLKNIIIKSTILQIIFLSTSTCSIKLKDHYLYDDDDDVSSSRRSKVGGSSNSDILIETIFQIFWVTIVSLGSIKIDELITNEFLTKTRLLKRNDQYDNRLDRFTNSSLSSSSRSSKGLKGFVRELICSRLDKILNVLNYLILMRLVFVKLPIPIGCFSKFTFSCVFNSFYCFENVWKTFYGIEFKDRTKKVEEDWMYHLGFGFIFTILTTMSSNLVIDLIIFTLIYPYLLVIIIVSMKRKNIKGRIFSQKPDDSKNYLNSRSTYNHQDFKSINCGYGEGDFQLEGGEEDENRVDLGSSLVDGSRDWIRYDFYKTCYHCRIRIQFFYLPTKIYQFYLS